MVPASPYMVSNITAATFGSLINYASKAWVSLYGTRWNPGVCGPKFSPLEASLQAPEAVIDLPQKQLLAITTLAVFAGTPLTTYPHFLDNLTAASHASTPLLHDRNFSKPK